MNFSTLQGVKIPEGTVTEIKDANGNILWTANKPAVLEVVKVTTTTYDGETEYQNEKFILLDIYPKKNGTVKITYGGITKTVTDKTGIDTPNAISVYFGTFGGVSDSISTPDSGILQISGSYRGYGCGTYKQLSSSKTTNRNAYCINNIIDIGNPIIIPSYAFADSDTTINTIPNSVTSIGDYAFRGCSSLTSISIPDSVTSIGSSAFYGCSSLTSISIPDGVTSIGNYAFYGCSSLTSIVIPDSVTSIGDHAFYECRSLTSVVIPDSVTSIGDEAFYNCSNIQFHDNFFKEGLVSIGAHAFDFSHCVNDIVAQFDITIPSTVTTIGRAAFYGTRPDYAAQSGTYFKRITMMSKTPPTIEYDTVYPDVFSAVYSWNPLDIIVPKGCSNTYKNDDGWNVYANYIKEVT